MRATSRRETPGGQPRHQPLHRRVGGLHWHTGIRPCSIRVYERAHPETGMRQDRASCRPQRRQQSRPYRLPEVDANRVQSVASASRNLMDRCCPAELRPVSLRWRTGMRHQYCLWRWEQGTKTGLRCRNYRAGYRIRFPAGPPQAGTRGDEEDGVKPKVTRVDRRATCHAKRSGAGYQIRTGDLQLGKLTLYR